MIISLDEYDRNQKLERNFTPEKLQTSWKAEDQELLKLIYTIYYDVFVCMEEVLDNYGGSNLLARNRLKHAKPLSNLMQLIRPKVVGDKKIMDIVTGDKYGCLTTIVSTGEMSLCLYPVEIRQGATLHNMDYKTMVISAFCHEMMHFASTEFDPILNKVRQSVSDTVSPGKNFMLGDMRYFSYKSGLQVEWHKEGITRQLHYDLTAMNEAMTDMLAREAFTKLRAKFPELIKGEYFIGYPKDVAGLERELYQRSQQNSTTIEEEFSRLARAYSNNEYYAECFGGPEELSEELNFPWPIDEL